MIVSFNDNLNIKGSVFHIQTEYYKSKEQIICNIFKDGKVLKKIPLEVEFEEGIEEMVREFHFFVLNRFKNFNQFQVEIENSKEDSTKENIQTKSKDTELDFLSKSIEEIDKDFFAFLKWVSEQKETLVLGLKCSGNNGYLSFHNGKLVGFKCGKFFGYQGLQESMKQTPRLIKIIKASNSAENKQFCFSLDFFFNNSENDRKGNEILIPKVNKLLNELSRVKGFVSLMLLDDFFNIRWGYQERNLNINIELMRDFCLTRIKKILEHISSENWHIILNFNKYILIFDCLQNNRSGLMLTVFDSKGNVALGQKKIQEALASQ